MFERYVLGVQSHRTSGGVTRCLGDDILGSALVETRVKPRLKKKD